MQMHYVFFCHVLAHIFFYFLSFIQEPMDKSMPSIVGDPVAESTLAYVEEQPSLQVSVS